MVSDNQLDQYFQFPRTCYWKKLLVNHSPILPTTSIKTCLLIQSLDEQMHTMLVCNQADVAGDFFRVTPKQVTYKCCKWKCFHSGTPLVMSYTFKSKPRSDYFVICCFTKSVYLLISFQRSDTWVYLNIHQSINHGKGTYDPLVMLVMLSCLLCFHRLCNSYYRETAW